MPLGTMARAQHFTQTSYAFLNNMVQRRTHKRKYLLHDQLPHEVIFRMGLMSVRHYHVLDADNVLIEGKRQPVQRQRYRIPLVMVPPLGVFAWIFDLMVDRSLVRYFLAHGYEVYLIDWGAPTRDDKHLTLETYVGHWFPLAMQAIREDSGSQQLSLLGYCMGGLLSLFYVAAHRDQDVVNLITIASPVDSHKTLSGKLSAFLEKPAHALHTATGFRIDKLDQKYFHIPGSMLSVMFKLTSPIGVVSSYLELIRNLADDDYVARYMTMREWFNNMPDYPGGTVQEVMRNIGLYNHTLRGLIRIGDKNADLSSVTSNLLAFAGESDAIVSIPAAEAILDLVNSRDKTFHVVPGGHAGVFTGSKAAHSTWAISAAWLSTRSGERVD